MMKVLVVVLVVVIFFLYTRALVVDCLRLSRRRGTQEISRPNCRHKINMSSFGNRFKRGGGHFASSARYEALDGESLMTAQEQVKRCCCCCFLSALSSFARDDDDDDLDENVSSFLSLRRE